MFVKFYVFLVALQSRYYVIIGLAVLGVGAGFYYYLKVVRAMYWDDVEDDRKLAVSSTTKAGMALLTLVIVVLGVYPTPILNWFAQG